MYSLEGSKLGRVVQYNEFYIVLSLTQSEQFHNPKSIFVLFQTEYCGVTYINTLTYLEYTTLNTMTCENQLYVYEILLMITQTVKISTLTPN